MAAVARIGGPPVRANAFEWGGGGWDVARRAPLLPARPSDKF